VLDSNRERLQDGRLPDGGSQLGGEGSVEQVYLDHLAMIRKAAAHACRRYGFSREEVEDFTQEVLLKIMADDYAVLRKHQGRSKLSTYLVIVVNHALQDHADRLWGKWRPSEEARRHGEVGIQLQRLLDCDRATFSEACQILRTNYGFTATEAELARIEAQLPLRLPRRVDSWREGEGGTPGAAAGSRPTEPAAVEGADERLWSHERTEQRRRAFQALAAALRTLPEDEWLMARRLTEGRSVAQIARGWHLDQKRQKQLYKQRERILKKLRQAMERAGVRAEDVAEILDRAGT
jgi:RNA polymerase sigma factor (sigma-70 family)